MIRQSVANIYRTITYRLKDSGESSLPKVMIVDDDANSTSLLKTLLEMDGFEVAIVLRGLEVFAKAQHFQPDVMIVDYHLNDISGIDVIHQLRDSAEFAQLPIVMASGRDVGKEARAAGANMFLVKPYDPGQLADQLMNLLG
ncbi:MAG: response regulator [Anaerolineales bacterium]|nr:response regulator [Anaerolineales bacterium]